VIIRVNLWQSFSSFWTDVIQNSKMIMENKKQTLKRIMIKTKIRTTGFIKRIRALAKISGDSGQRNPNP
jgi:hypothetical protein